ncbi:MAG TPA: hypothetical protein VGI63_10165 [Verrucomicrobiae bacterium]
MKKIFTFIALFILGMSATIRAADSTNSLVWCGLDYSMAKMIGAGDFRKPTSIFPGMLHAWNGLFMKELFPELESSRNPWPSVKTDVKAVYSRNEKATPNQIIRDDGTYDEMVKTSHITESDIATAVKSYELKNDQGIGLVFIIDRLVKEQDMGCLYVVYFDIASRKVLYSERVISKGEGFGFRNFWFHPIKDTMGKLSKMYKKAKESRAEK